MQEADYPAAFAALRVDPERRLSPAEDEAEAELQLYDARVSVPVVHADSALRAQWVAICPGDRVFLRYKASETPTYKGDEYVVAEVEQRGEGFNDCWLKLESTVLSSVTVTVDRVSVVQQALGGTPLPQALEALLAPLELESAGLCPAVARFALAHAVLPGANVPGRSVVRDALSGAPGGDAGKAVGMAGVRLLDALVAPVFAALTKDCAPTADRPFPRSAQLQALLCSSNDPATAAAGKLLLAPTQKAEYPAALAALEQALGGTPLPQALEALLAPLELESAGLCAAVARFALNHAVLPGGHVPSSTVVEKALRGAPGGDVGKAVGMAGVRLLGALVAVISIDPTADRLEECVAAREPASAEHAAFSLFAEAVRSRDKARLQLVTDYSDALAAHEAHVTSAMTTPGFDVAQGLICAEGVWDAARLPMEARAPPAMGIQPMKLVLMSENGDDVPKRELARFGFEYGLEHHNSLKRGPEPVAGGDVQRLGLRVFGARSVHMKQSGRVHLASDRHVRDPSQEHAVLEGQLSELGEAGLAMSRAAQRPVKMGATDLCHMPLHCLGAALYMAELIKRLSTLRCTWCALRTETWTSTRSR